MSKTYKLSVNKSTSFEFTEQDLEKLDAVSIQENHFHILNKHKAFQAELITTDFNSRKYTVKVNGNTYQVDIATPLDSLIKEMGISLGAGKVVNAIKAPMPGLILEVAVQVGQEVQENDTLLILEAMEMENTLFSPRAGVIKSVSIEKGNAVEKGQLLIEFE